MAESSKITPNIQASRLQALGTSRAGPIWLYAAKLGARVQTQAARNLSGSMVKVRTGNLRSSLSAATEVKGTLLVETVTADAEYALWVHDGTKAHDVVPLGARVLCWQSPAGAAFATRVHIPAQAGRPFLASALTVINQ